MAIMNGHKPPRLAGAVQQDAPPIVGQRRCRISRPLLVPPTYSNRFGAAWRVDLGAIRSRLTAFRKPDSMVAHWIVEAPWSSEVVHSYSLVIAHLRWQLGTEAATKYRQDATHEVALWAISPQAERADMLVRPVDYRRQWLAPAVFVGQIACASDDAAERQAFRAVELVCSGRLSPHPAHVRAWAQMYGDDVLKHAVAADGGGDG